MTYRLYTENLNRLEIESKASEVFPNGFTSYEARGYWGDVGEDSLVIEVADAEYAKVRDLAKWIKKLNSQEAIGIQAIESAWELV